MDGTRPITMADCTECWAVPGAGHIIDVIHPETGLTWCFGKDEARVKETEPAAVRMPIADWTRARAAAQRTPIRWRETDRASFTRMLEILPPIDWTGDAFLVGEPHDHEADTGRPRYQAFRKCGERYYASSRPLTRGELRAERARACSCGARS